MKANALDNPNWYQAMNGSESDGYWAAMEIEMETLIVKDAWICPQQGGKYARTSICVGL
jgi:hypothetical protein